MRIFGYAYEAFDGPVVSFAVQRSWARNNGETLVRFLSATAKASRWLFDTNNRDQAVRILQRNAKVDAEIALKNYDLWFGPQAMMARDLALPASGIQAYLDLRGSKADVSKYLDMTYAKRALER
jgi:ABC-type nitrate/sulfonate/bicarbonate transport system substrate-binding protein